MWARLRDSRPGACLIHATQPTYFPAFLYIVEITYDTVDEVFDARLPVPRPDPQVPDATLGTRGRDHREAEEEFSPRVGAYAPVVVPDPIRAMDRIKTRKIIN